MISKIFQVLVLCTGNSARSIMAECLFNRLGDGRLQAHSAGSQPSGSVNLFALELLRSKGYATEGLYSKSWDVFAETGAPEFDFVFTVCDSAGAETCPVWPGAPLCAHWGLPDPAAVTGGDAAKRAAFVEAYETLEIRITAFAALPLERLDADAIKAHLQDLGAEPKSSGVAP